MIKTITFISSYLFMMATCFAQIVYEDDFSTYSAGTSIAGPDWDPKDSGGQSGLMTGSGTYGVLSGLAEASYHIPSKHAFSLDSTNTASISSDFRYSHLSGGNITTSVNQPAFGILITTTPSWSTGNNHSSPFSNRGGAIGMKLPLNPWQEGWITHGSLGVNTTTGGVSDWFTLETKLTPSNGTVWVKTDLINSADSVLIPGLQWDTGLSDSISLHAGYTTGYNGIGSNLTEFAKFDEVHVDNFKIRLGEEVPPGITTNSVTVSVDLTRKRSIGGVKTLDREQWFGVYHETGYARSNFTDDGVTMTRDEWINEEGRMWASRGTVNFENMTEDPARPSYVDPAEFSDLNGIFDSRYAWAKEKAPSHKTVMSGEGHGKYPAYMCWDPTLTSGIKTVSNNVAHAEAVVNTLTQLESRNGLMPHWFEVMNESSIQNNYGWHWDSDAWDKLSEFHYKVADAVHNSVYSNVVKVAGPTDAYPFRDDSDGDFSQYEGSNKKFIQLAGDKMDAYAIHTYEQMVTNSTSSFDDQYSKFEIWHQGRLASFVDLWENDHHLIHGGTRPFVFSEYGLLNNKNPYGDRNAYYQIRSCNGILLSLMDRPDIVDKMSAFLMTQAPYNWNQKRVFFASEDSGNTMYKTSYFDYLRFWHDLDGDYLFSETDNQHLVARSFLDNNDTLYVVMKNNFNTPFLVDLETLLPAGAATGSAEIQRIYFNGTDDVTRDPFSPLASLDDMVVVPDETVMLRVSLSAIPALITWEEFNHYGSQTLVPMVGNQAETFTFDVPKEQIGGNAEGRVNMSLYAFSGFSGAPAHVEVNGTVITNVPDVSYTAGAPRSWKQIAALVPAGVLKEGLNSVVITPAEGGSLKKITSIRLTTVSAIGDSAGDGVPDWWKLEHELDPFADSRLVDSDLDGYTDADEYICGTEPKNINSFLKVSISPVLVSNGIRINFASASNRLYAIEVSDNLTTNHWYDATNGISGTDDWIQLIDPATETNRFYRLKVEVE